MALFPNSEQDYTFKGRTHTNLVVSEGDAPAQDWIVDKDENANVKFQYPYGPEGNQNVVLAKGKIVEAGPAQYDAEYNRVVNSIKQATADSTSVLGVNHHNLYERKRDRFSGGNQGNPTVITRNYIEVPLFEHGTLGTAQQFASAMNYGAAYGTNDGNQLLPGDYVKVGADGNFVKLDTANDNPFQAVGQVMAAERELPPAGFLQYYMDMDIPQLEEFFKTLSHAPSPGNNGKDAGAYPYGYPYTNKGWKTNFEDLLNPKINNGIPFLTDGYFKARESVTGITVNDIYNATSNNDGHVEVVRTSGDVTFGSSADSDANGAYEFTAGTTDPSALADADGNVSIQTAAETRNNAVFVKLRHEFDKIEMENGIVTVTYEDDNMNTVTLSDADVHLDFTHNMAVLYLEPGKNYHNVSIDAKLVVDPVAGVPTEWDYKGSVGAVRILLQK